MLVCWDRLSATTCFDLLVSSIIGAFVPARTETRGGYKTKAFSKKEGTKSLGVNSPLLKNLSTYIWKTNNFVLFIFVIQLFYSFLDICLSACPNEALYSPLSSSFARCRSAFS